MNISNPQVIGTRKVITGFKALRNNDLDDILVYNNEQEMADELVTEKSLSVHRKVTLIEKVIKRIFDILISIVGIIIMLPIALVVKISYLLTGDRSSIFYKQRRIGKDGKIIYMYKFRSMVNNADEVLKELLKDEKYKKEWDTYQKFENDPRITKVGKFLRKTSIDELPQFINIFKGDMSLIGPRPLVEGELDAHNGNHDIYESVRPGLTSYWAINGRSSVSYQQRLNLEYYYINNMSLLLDTKIFFKTFSSILKKEGAV